MNTQKPKITPTFKSDQNSVEARKQFIDALLQNRKGGLITSDDLCQFALKYGFALENAFKAVQSAIDHDMLDAELFDNTVLFITHREEFIQSFNRNIQQEKEFNERVNQEILRLEKEYQQDTPAQPTLSDQPLQFKPKLSEEPSSGNSKIRARQRMRP